MQMKEIRTLNKSYEFVSKVTFGNGKQDTNCTLSSAYYLNTVFIFEFTYLRKIS